MTAATCPVCGTETSQRIGVVIGGAWRYCWLCPKCGNRWGWASMQNEASTAIPLTEFVPELEPRVKGEYDELRRN
jgi:ribosomal protein L37AE/L43A